MNRVQEKKDPRGLVAADMRHLRSVFPRPAYTPRTTLADIMYTEGTQRVLDYIEQKMVASRPV